MLEFISRNASAVFALGGAVVGALASFLTSWLVVRRQLQFRLSEKLLDKRIAAYEAVLELCNEMRGMVNMEQVAPSGELLRYPIVMSSEEHFANWQARLGATTAGVSRWLHVSLVRELTLLHDYVLNLQMNLQDASADAFHAVGALVRLDFLAFAMEFERLSMEFFRNDIHRLRTLPGCGNYGYSPEDKTARLSRTEMGRNSVEIKGIVALDKGQRPRP